MHQSLKLAIPQCHLKVISSLQKSHNVCLRLPQKHTYMYYIYDMMSFTSHYPWCDIDLDTIKETTQDDMSPPLMSVYTRFKMCAHKTLHMNHIAK